MKTPIVAVIEVGSKGVRLLVETLNETGRPQTIRSPGKIVNLAEEMPDEGKFCISKEKLEHAAKEVNGCLKKIQDIQGENQTINVYMIGTEVLRRARSKNVKEFLECNRQFEPFKTWEQTGQIQFDILKNPKKFSQAKTEAYYAFLAVTEKGLYDIDSSSLPALPDLSNIIVLDHGGGSTEVAFGQLKNGSTEYRGGRSFPDLGSAILRSKVRQDHVSESLEEIEKYVESIKGPTPDFVKSMAEHFEITKESLKNLRKMRIPDKISEDLEVLKNLTFSKKNKFLAAVEERIGKNQLAQYQELIFRYASVTNIFALGSSITDLAWTAFFRGQHYSSRKIHGVEITLDNIEKVITQSKKELITRSIEDLEKLLEVNDVVSMLCGLIVYQKFLKIYKQDKLQVCGFGLRYGFAYEKLHEQVSIETGSGQTKEIENIR